MSVICDICNTKVSNKYNLIKHKLTESCQKIKREFDYNNNIINLNNKIKELEKEIEQLKIENNEKDKLIHNLQEKSNILKEKSEEYRKIVEKAATKSTTIKNTYTNSNNHNNHNNYLNYISQEPIKFSEMKKQIQNVITTKTIMYDEEDFHDHIVDNILRDNKGKDKVLCTDINRKNFSYKDEKSGEIVSDPELERLREQLKRGTDTKTLKKDLLENLITKYNGSHIDPYNKFYEILKKLEFGAPFIDHLAKKTYVKTKTNDTVDNEIIDKENKENKNIITYCDKNDALKLLDSIDNIDNMDINNVDMNNLYYQLKDEFMD
jgi:hypothetical protein